MKRLLPILSLLIATPAMAQQGPTPEQFVSGLQVDVSDALTRVKATMAGQAQQIAALQKQVSDDKAAAETAKKAADDAATKSYADGKDFANAVDAPIISGIKAENEVLTKQVSDLTAENAKLKAPPVATQGPTITLPLPGQSDAKPN